MKYDSHKSMLPPGPKAKPFVGNLPEFRQDPIKFLTDLARTFGDVARFKLGTSDVVQLSNPVDIKEVLVTNARCFVKTGLLERARPLLGNGLITTAETGEFHRRQRKIMQPALGRQQVLAYAPVTIEFADRMSRHWTDGDRVDMFKEMMELTLLVIAKAMFDLDLRSETGKIETALTTALEHINHLLNPYSAWLSKLPLARNRRFRRALEVLDEVVYGVIERGRRSDRDLGFLSTLLTAEYEESGGQRMSDKQVRDEIMTMMMAGHETVATGLTWTWYALSQNPAVEAKLHEELDRVLGDRLPTADDLPHLKYTEWVFAESMRLYPPVWNISRKTKEEIEIGSFVIPAGTMLGMSQYVVHHDSRFYAEPERFEPLRWTDEEKTKRPKYAYFPFGGGPRLCIGEPFAWMEGMLVIATLAQRWKMRFVSEHQAEFEPLISLRPKNGMPMLVERRDH